MLNLTTVIPSALSCLNPTNLFNQTSTPGSSSGVSIGDLWIDQTATPVNLYICTGTGPVVWSAMSGGSGSPAGSDTQIQYNASGSFAANSGLTYNYSTNVLSSTFSGNLTGNASTVTTNANLTGPVTSTGNVTAIANGTITNAMLATPYVSPLTTKGDINIYGSSNTRFPVGSNYYFLKSDSTQTSGLSYDIPQIEPQVGFGYCNDFMAGLTADTAVNGVVSGTGAACSIAQASIDSSHLGILKLDMGTTTTGSASAVFGGTNGFGPMYLVNGSSITLETEIYLSALSNGTDTYTLTFGLASTTAPTFSNGIYITYTNGTNSGTWVLTSNKTSVSTSSNGASGPTATTWYKLKLIIGTNTVTGYVATAGNDFTAIGTVSATFTTSNLFFLCSLLKSAGTTDIFSYLDYARTKVIYNTVR